MWRIGYRGGIDVIEQLTRTRSGLASANSTAASTCTSASSSMAWAILSSRTPASISRRPKCRNGVEPAQPLGFFAGAVLGRIHHRVATKPLADGLDQTGPTLGPRTCQCGPGGVAHRDNVVAVDPFPRDPVGTAALVQVGFRGRLLHRGPHAQAVVDDHVHDRQLPQSGQIERFVKRADIGGAVTKDTHHRLRVGTGAFAVGECKRRTGCRRDLAADDAVSPE